MDIVIEDGGYERAKGRHESGFSLYEGTIFEYPIGELRFPS